MAHRSKATILAARATIVASLPVVDTPVPKSQVSDGLSLEVLLDIRECLQKILVTCGGENLEA
jgi:hypothetical protein